ncbi:uncharacterized protein [Pyxicephalus adspersus]|uniref:uncharacterized protein n=1 Tax=Pyxicephalus adspersus TaxID=30357 RepID=UPI003B5BED81
MAHFSDFLQGTLGFHLLHFWMDCEQFKEESVDLEANQSPEEARHRCVHLFRSIQNKYRTYLSPAWQEQIRLSQQDWGPSYQALRRSQYDALRRLRAYWIPRFLIHQQRRLRFEPPQYTQIFLLWQELTDYRESDPSDGGKQPGVTRCGTRVYLPSYPAGCDSGGHDALGPSHVTPEQTQSSDFWSMYRLVLTALCDPWLRFLSYDIATFLQYCTPVSCTTKEMEILGSSSPKAGPKRGVKESQQCTGNSEDTKKKVRRRKDHLRLAKVFPEYPGQPPSELDAMLEMLQDRTMYKVYRKVVQETEEPQTMKVLEILHILQSDKSEQKMVGLVQKVLELDIIHLPHMQGLKKHLTHEMSKGRISSLFMNDVILFLSSLLAPSFQKFFSEILNQLKDYGVEQPGDTGWPRLEPILQVITNKMVLKRLHGRKNNAGHLAQMQPTVEDINAFNRALQLSAEGWPTPEVLHFLRYLQTHGTEEGLPLLENNLLCCLEIQKYKNAHHAMPDRGLLRRKVQVVKERFLLSQENPVLQAPQEILEVALTDIEAAVHSDLPATSIFDQLHSSLCDSLLPFWAGFRKTWRIRSLESAKKVPMLRMQQMLRKRLALFEVEDTPLRTFHLPPVQHPPEKGPQSVLTFSFSITHGVTVKGRSENGGKSQTPTPPASRKMSQIAVLPPINRTSPDRTKLNGNETTAGVPELISSQ